MPEMSKFYGIIIYMYLMTTIRHTSMCGMMTMRQKSRLRTALLLVLCPVVPCGLFMNGSTCTATN